MWPRRVRSPGPGTPIVTAGGTAGSRAGLRVDGPGGWPCLPDMVPSRRCGQVSSVGDTPCAQVTREKRNLFLLLSASPTTMTLFAHFLENWH